MSNPVAYQKDQLWSVDGLGFPASYYFFAATPGATKQTHDKFNDGGSVRQEVQVPEAQNDDVTLIALYRAADHRAVCLDLRTRLERRELIPATLKQLDCDADKTPIGEVSSRNGYLNSVKWPDHASDSTTKGQIELVFTVPTQ